MAELGDGPGLTIETRAVSGVVGEFRRQDLDRDLTIGDRVECAPHLTHPALAEPGLQFVAAERLAHAIPSRSVSESSGGPSDVGRNGANPP